ncbi:transposase [Ensifer aridi]|uniref:transposase n=1 Tax=Ensifer aridi TaxID=1708715 RepID=UPI00358F2355
MTRRRYGLTDHEWSILSPLLPNKPPGVARVDDRRVLNGILWRFRTGSSWAEIPERYGRRPPATIASSTGGRPVFLGSAS